MATLKSDAVKDGIMFVDGPIGAVLCRSASFTGKPGNGDVLQMIPVPKGAMVVGYDLIWEALAASTTVKIGDGDDDDRYAGTTAHTVTAAGAAHGVAQGYLYTADDTIDITFGGAAQAADKTVKMNLYYKIVAGACEQENSAFKA